MVQGKATLFIGVFILTAWLVFSPKWAQAFNDMARMGNGDIPGAGAASSFSMVMLKPGQPVSRVIDRSLPRTTDSVASPGRMNPASMEDLPEAFMSLVAAGNPIGFTLNDKVYVYDYGLVIDGTQSDPRLNLDDLEVKVWGRAYEPYWGWVEEPESLILIHSTRIHSGYYDVGMERRGWELDYWQWERNLQNVRITGIDRQPLQLEKVIAQIRYEPMGWEPSHIARAPFNVITAGGRIPWFYRQGYILYFEY